MSDYFVLLESIQLRTVPRSHDHCSEVFLGCTIFSFGSLAPANLVSSNRRTIFWSGSLRRTSKSFAAYQRLLQLVMVYRLLTTQIIHPTARGALPTTYLLYHL